MSGTTVGNLPGIGQSAASRAVARGEKLSQVVNLRLTE